MNLQKTMPKQNFHEFLFSRRPNFDHTQLEKHPQKSADSWCKGGHSHVPCSHNCDRGQGLDRQFFTVWPLTAQNFRVLTVDRDLFDPFGVSCVLRMPSGTSGSRKELVLLSGVAKAGPGRALARPKHHVRPTHVTRSGAKHFVRAARIQQVPGQYQWPGYATGY